MGEALSLSGSRTGHSASCKLKEVLQHQEDDPQFSIPCMLPRATHCMLGVAFLGEPDSLERVAESDQEARGASSPGTRNSRLDTFRFREHLKRRG